MTLIFDGGEKEVQQEKEKKKIYTPMLMNNSL